MGIYYGAGEEANYLAGMSAGAATESNIIGFVAPFPIPEVIRHINAYTLGAQSVNPDATVKVVWVNSWFDPTNERQAADSLIAAGADVIASGGDSPAPGEAAKAAGLAWTGYDSDQSANFPDEWLTAAVYNWGPYYTEQVQGRARRHLEAPTRTTATSPTASPTSPRSATRVDARDARTRSPPSARRSSTASSTISPARSTTRPAR